MISRSYLLVPSKFLNNRKYSSSERLDEMTNGYELPQLSLTVLNLIFIYAQISCILAWSYLRSYQMFIEIQNMEIDTINYDVCLTLKIVYPRSLLV